MDSPLGLTLLKIPAIENLVSTPTYTDIFNETMGDAAGDTDSLNGHIDNLAKLATAFEAEVNATVQEHSVGDAIARLGDIHPGGLDASMAGYTGAMGAGSQHVIDGQKLAPPKLLELPVSSTPLSGISAPPKLDSHDFGTVHLDSAPLSFHLGRQTIIGNDTSGIFDAQVFDSGDGVFDVVTTEHDTASGNMVTKYDLQMTPLALGPHTGQINVTEVPGMQLTILTVTVNVIP